MQANIRIRSILLSSLILLILSNSSIMGASSRTVSSLPINNGFYISAVALTNLVGGDFNGDIGLIDQDQIVLIPDLGSSIGGGIAIGMRSGHSEGEMSHFITSSNSIWQGQEFKARVYNSCIDARWYLYDDRRIQPFAQFGGGILKLVVDYSSVPTDTADFQISDSRFYDFEVHGGIGVAAYVQPRLSIRASVLYRLVSFTGSTIEGVAGTIVPPRGINANTLSLLFGVSYAF